MPTEITYQNGQKEALTFAPLSITERYKFIDLLVAGETPHLVALCTRRKIEWVESLDPECFLELASGFLKANFPMAMRIAEKDPIAGLKVGPLMMQIGRVLSLLPSPSSASTPAPSAGSGADSPTTPAPAAAAAPIPAPSALSLPPISATG